MVKRLRVILLILCTTSTIILAQNRTYDILNHKYFGEIKGKVLQVSDNVVQFKILNSGLIYDYEKKNINYIIYSSGQWVSFNENKKVFVNNIFGGWGFFHFSAGFINNRKPAKNSNIWKTGLSINADLNYQVSELYSLGLFIGYDAVTMKSETYLKNIAGLSSLNSGTSGGNLYQLKFGFVNRFWLFNSSFISPVISLSGGYQNLIFSEIELNSSGVKSTIPGFTRDGFLFACGLGLKFSVGEKSGFLLSSNYNWFFSKGNRFEYLTLHLGYILPIN